MRLAIVLLLSSLGFAQGMGGRSGIGGKAGFGGGVSAGGGTWTLSNQIRGRAVWATNYILTGNNAVLTVPSMTAGHGFIILMAEGNGVAAPTVTCTNCTWTNQANGHVTSGAVGGVSAATGTVSSSGATTITVAYASAPSDPVACFYDGAWSGSTITVDDAKSRNSGTSETNPAGVTLVIGGTSDMIATMNYNGVTPSAAAAPYNTNFSNTTTDGSSDPMGTAACSVAINTTSQPAPSTWTAAASFDINTAAALKGN